MQEMNCRNVRRIIDEADRPSVLPYDAARHIDACAECKKVSEERSKLFELITSGGRVQAPANFDLLLRARLAGRPAKASRRVFGSIYFKLAGAMAAVVMALVLAQHSMHQVPVSQTPIAVQGHLMNPPSGPPEPKEPATTKGTVLEGGTGYSLARARRGGPQPVRANPHTPATPMFDPTVESVARLVIRGPVAESELRVPAVSIGSQPMFYIASGDRASGGKVSF